MKRVINLVINGEEKNVPASDSGITLADLLLWLQIKPDRVAVELNRVIAPRDRWPQTPLSPGDQLEIVQFVGGG